MMMMIGDTDDDNYDDDDNDDGGQVKTGKSSLPVETCWNWRELCSPNREKNRDSTYHNSWYILI